MAGAGEELVFAPLGGVGEIGMNLALYGIGDGRGRQWVAVDFGVAFAGDDLPGTGTPEIAGLTAAQGVEIIRGCGGLDLVGGDVVEVAPQYDPSGNTALLGANLLYEMLCVLPGVERR